MAKQRPTTFDEFTGQQRACRFLSVAIEAAKQRGDVLEHVLLSGPPGLGKTTLAKIAAGAMGGNLIACTGPSLKSPKDVLGTLLKLNKGDILFIDEVHRMPMVVEEFLYTAMEDAYVDFVVKATGQSVTINLEKFTLIGATTIEGMLSKPFRDRYGIVLKLEPYSVDELADIVNRAGVKAKFGATSGACVAIARRSRGTPRIALKIYRRACDVASTKSHVAVVYQGDVIEACDLMGIDEYGLGHIDREILRVLNAHETAIGLNTIAALVDEAESTIQETHEPYLLREGFMAKTARGRAITDKGRQV